jgi:hypothetical protein
MKKKCISILTECIRNELQLSKVTNNDNSSLLECVMSMSESTDPMTQRHIPEDLTHQRHQCENLKICINKDCSYERILQVGLA